MKREGDNSYRDFLYDWPAFQGIPSFGLRYLAFVPRVRLYNVYEQGLNS